MADTFDGLEARLAYTFRKRELIERALTHKSRAFEKSAATANALTDNEQLEFLGDSVLGFLVSEALVSRHPTYPEGRLSELKAYLVSAQHLHGVASRIELGGYLFLGRGEELSGGREKKALLANALEALIAALYLDGGMDVVRQFVTLHVIAEFDMERGLDHDFVVDYKSRLQEEAQLRGLPVPRYIVARESGPEHRKVFTVEARVGTGFSERAEGTSKKAAGQRAAQLVLERILEGPADNATEPRA